MIRTGASCGADCAVVLVFLLPLAGGVWGRVLGAWCARVLSTVGRSGGGRWSWLRPVVLVGACAIMKRGRVSARTGMRAVESVRSSLTLVHEHESA